MAARESFLKTPNHRGFPELKTLARAAFLASVLVVCRWPLEAASDSTASARSIALPDHGWPQWRGPRRDGICDETGLLQTWPEGGPPKVWTTTNVGKGWSAPIVADGRIVLTGDFEERLEIVALNLAGETVWRATNGLAWRGEYPGARSSVTYRDGRLVHKNAHGRVAAFDAHTGRELWAVETLKRFEGKNITWGLSESVLVDGERVIVTVGGKRAIVAALDIKTGDTVWASEPLLLGVPADAAHARVATPAGEADSSGYVSPILVDLGGRRQIVGCSLRHVFGVDAATGRLLWSRPFSTRYSVIAATPALLGQGVFVTAPDAGGGRLFGVSRKGEGIEVEEVWTSRLDSGQGGVVKVGDRLYGSWYRGRKGWACIDVRNGNLVYETPEVAMGPVLYAEGRLYWLSQEGEMSLVEPTVGEFVPRGRFRLAPKGVSDAWTHPVIHDGSLYLRYHDQFHCFDVRR